jgi:hypothetical protein
VVAAAGGEEADGGAAGEVRARELRRTA